MIASLAAARVRRPRGDDDGFALVFTLLVITLVSIMVGGAITVATANIRPSVRTAYSQSAEAAAQAGLDAFLAKLNDPAYSAASCTGTTISAGNCTPPSPFASTFTNAGGYTASYAVSAAPGTTWFRVTSTGTVSRGGEHATKTLTADMAGGASTNVRDYSAVTGYETQAPDVVAAQFPARAIALSPSAQAAAHTSVTPVTWGGATTSGSAGSVNTCNALYQGLAGRSHQGPPNATTPYVDWSETGSAGTDVQPCQVSLGTQTQLVAPANPANGVGGYATRDALLLSNSYPGGSGPLLNQPVTTGYRYDAATATSCDKPGQDYRSFTLLCAGYPVDVGGAPRSGSQYSPRHNDTIPAVPTAAPTVPGTGSCVYSGPTRVRLNSDGTATVTSPYTTSALTGSPASCYPSSLSGGISFYTTPVLSSISGFNGVISVQSKGTAPSTTPARHSSTGWNLSGQRVTDATTDTPGHSVFYVASAAPATGPDTPTSVPGTFSNPGDNVNTWTAYSATKKCGAVSRQTDTPNGPKPWDEQTFQCDWFNRMGDNTFLPPTAPDDGYTAYKTKLTSDLASATPQTVSGNPGNTVKYSLNGGTAQTKTVDCSSQTFLAASASADQLVCLLQHDLRQANTGSNEANWSNPSKTGYTHQYLVDSYSQTSTTAPNTVVGAVPSVNANGDKLFDSAAVTGRPSTETATTTATTVTVASQVYGCYNYGLVGGLLGDPKGTMDVNGSNCTGLLPTGRWAWGNGYYPNQTSPQFQFTITQKTYSNFQLGSSAAAFFPFAADVTQYAKATDSNNAPGDLYVEGSTSKTLALVAANDAVITGSLGSSGSAGLELVARDDVRVYHPVSCTSSDVTALNATDAGFCPNDITGLYSGVPASAVRPDQQYTTMRSDLRDLSVNGIVFALGNMVSSLPCPQPLSGDPGVCGGQFGVDNYDRGGDLGTLSVTGTVVMQHHGPVGREWEIADATGQGSRPNSGYQLRLGYQNLAATIDANPSVGGVVSGVTTTSSKWHVISVSTGGP